MHEIHSSVIVCVRNRAQQVLCCLESLLASDRHNFEIVVVDDASTDNTPSALEKFQRTHRETPITIVRNDVNLGVSGARNAGIEAARGVFVFFTDSDCVVQADWLGRMVDAFATHNVDVVAGMVIDSPASNLAERAYQGGSTIGRNHIQVRRLIGGNMGFRRELLRRYRFDDSLQYGCDEDDLALRLVEDGHQIAFVPEAIVLHEHPLTLSSYLRMGFLRGKGSARFWYKHGKLVGRDLAALAAALVTLPLGILDVRLLLVPAFFVCLQMAAILYNQIVFKSKGPFEALWVLPVEILYYAARASGAVSARAAIAVGRDPAIRASKRNLRESRGAAV